MLADPVAARFDRSTLLINCLSADSPAEELPARIPTVTNRCRLPPTPWDAPHRKDVSDSHVVRSHDDALSLTADVNTVEPKPPPRTVTLADPVVAAFVLSTELLMSESKENPWVLLPTVCNVTDTWRLPITPSPVWHRTDVSDAHAVLSHAVRPKRDPAVYVPSPKLAPCTVTLAEPVDAAFRLRTPLNRPTSVLYPCERLPNRTPLVIATRRLPLRLWPAWQRTDVSASHVVRSQLVWLTFTDEECAPAPMLPPCMVKLAEPLAALFVLLTVLAMPTSTLCAVLTLPTRPAVVSSKRRLPDVA